MLETPRSEISLRTVLLHTADPCAENTNWALGMDDTKKQKPAGLLNAALRYQLRPMTDARGIT